MTGEYIQHNRHSIRLEEYDYSLKGAYFVTICSRNRELIFENEVIKKIIEEEWLNSTNIRDNIALDEYVVMPNHFHGIIFITDRFTKETHSNRAYGNTPLRVDDNLSINDNIIREAKLKSPSQTIGSIIRGFKGASTKRINTIHNSAGSPVWQRNYYEHIIRNEQDLNETRKYIIENPVKWDVDEDNPNR